MQLWGQDIISQTPEALANEDVFLFGSLTSLPKKHGRKTARSGFSCFVSAPQWKWIVTAAVGLLRLGSTSALLPVCTGVVEELIFVEIDYLPRSSVADQGAWPLAFRKSWTDSKLGRVSEALAKVRKERCLFFGSGLVQVFKLGWRDFSFSVS